MKRSEILIVASLMTLSSLFAPNVNAQETPECYSCRQSFRTYILQTKKACQTLEACKTEFLEKPEFESCKSCDFQSMWKNNMWDSIAQCTEHCPSFLRVLLWEKNNPCSHEDNPKENCKKEFLKEKTWFDQCNDCNFEDLWRTVENHLPPLPPQ